MRVLFFILLLVNAALWAYFSLRAPVSTPGVAAPLKPEAIRIRNDSAKAAQTASPVGESTP